MIYVRCCAHQRNSVHMVHWLCKHYSNISGFPEYRCFIPHSLWSFSRRNFHFYSYFLLFILVRSSSSSSSPMPVPMPMPMPMPYICVLIHRCVTLDSEANIWNEQRILRWKNVCLFISSSPLCASPALPRRHKAHYRQFQLNTICAHLRRQLSAEISS